MRERRRGLRRRAGAVAVAGALLLAAGTAGSASASTGSVPDGDRAAAVRTVLDRVLGPGGSTVVVVISWLQRTRCGGR